MVKKTKNEVDACNSSASPGAADTEKLIDNSSQENPLDLALQKLENMRSKLIEKQKIDLNAKKNSAKKK